MHIFNFLSRHCTCAVRDVSAHEQLAEARPGSPRRAASIVQPGDVDGELIQDWVHVLLQTKGVGIYRMKGVLSVAGAASLPGLSKVLVSDPVSDLLFARVFRWQVPGRSSYTKQCT